jgi:Domain of unknown function (DUF6883)
VYEGRPTTENHGSMVSPDGRNPLMRTVWILEKGEDAPRLVTAYPLQEAR